MDNKLKILWDKLFLKEGGNRVVQLPEPHLQLLLEQAVVLPGKNVRMIPGMPSHCHENAGVLWLTHENQFLIGTGYALSEDGIWRQHSWLLDLMDNRVVETTLKRETYCGVFLDLKESLRFVLANCYKRSWLNYRWLLTKKDRDFYEGFPWRVAPQY